MAWASEWHTPVALISTRTSVVPSGADSIPSTISRSSSRCSGTAARMFSLGLLDLELATRAASVVSGRTSFGHYCNTFYFAPGGAGQMAGQKGIAR